ncbi:TTC31 protein, partial [Campylorhamphus procurvoides]|nr:TTC31 protein [Campylorhamphus procurvoides]
QELVAEEERVKRKAEKKKLKKKKQKDRKKREKLSQEQKNKENTDPVNPSPHPGNSTALPGEPGPENTEVAEVSDGPTRGCLGIGHLWGLPAYPLPPQEELDLSCTFVCKAREKAGVRLPPPGRDRLPAMGDMELGRRALEKGSGDTGEGPAPPQALQPEPPGPSTMEQSLVLAGHGIAAAQVGQHAEAVWAFSAALELNPREHRLLGNRSYCLEKLGRYEEALADAEAALELQPGWPKGSFRKGKALRGLQVPGAGWGGHQGRQEGLGLRGSGTGVSGAQEGAMAVGIPGVSPCPQWVLSPPAPLAGGWASENCQTGQTCDTRDRSVMGGSAGVPPRGPGRGPVTPTSHLTLPPSHPARDCFPLWVGNVTPHITEKVLRRTFGRFGEIHSVRMLPRRRCAFINFCGKVAAEEAYRAMQGATVEGSELVLQLKHPAHATPAPLPR